MLPKTNLRSRGGRLLILSGSLLTSVLLVILFISISLPAARAQPTSPEINKIDPELQLEMAKTLPTEFLDILIYLDGPAELPQTSHLESTLAARHLVVKELKDTASISQASLLNQLNQLSQDGHIEAIRSFWIINAVQVRIRASFIDELTSRPDISRLTLNNKIQLIEPGITSSVTMPAKDLWGLERIRVRHVLEGLGVDGSGVTVAIMDTGVDWHHMALTGNYRGYKQGFSPVHLGNWYDAVDSTTEPSDPHGHGTHVAGTAVGQGGIGVAPGANWIGVRILNQYGYGYVADIHAAFQWILAPNGDPALSPDLVNNSWTGHPELTDFLPDIAALDAAGIVPVFAAGNEGPDSGSIGAPANYPGTIAVGAIDDIGDLTWFSSRGPSGLTSAVKPLVVAPGARIYSSFPEDNFGYQNGTSMATPHVTGVLAILLSVNPNLTKEQLTTILSTTASPVGPYQPNMNSGWGTIDAYTAAAAIIEGAGRLTGKVSFTNIPLPNTLITVTTPAGVQLPLYSDSNGQYQASLMPGQYDVEIQRFGFNPHRTGGIIISANQTTIHDVNLNQLPYGTLTGKLLQVTTNDPVPGVIRIANTPVQAKTDENGTFLIELPIGTYEVTAFASGHELTTKATTILTNELTSLNFSLNPTLRLLIVDTAGWYYDSYVDYFKLALEQNNLAYDSWTIRNPYSDIPTTTDFIPYDALIWSSPLDSPGLIGAGAALSKYLDRGGNLFISGQNIANLDDVTSEPEDWIYRQLRAGYAGISPPPYELSGNDDSLFKGLKFSLNASDSAGNQTSPDLVRPYHDSLSEVAAYDLDGSATALYTHRCEPFRIVYTGFGLEGVGGAENRANIIGRSIDFFEQPETEFGIVASPDQINDFALSGQQLTFEIEILNLGEIITDTYTLFTENESWPTSIMTDTLELGPCQVGKTAVTINVPEGVESDTIETFQLIARSASFPGYSHAVQFQLKTPGKLLLVDDDRWFDQSATFQEALSKAGHLYDFWEIEGSPSSKGSPTPEILAAYDMVIWYTGYDWYQPITPAESEALISFLSSGGRLLLTSQDYLYYHHGEKLSRDFLGVHLYAESIEPDKIYDESLVDLTDIVSTAFPLDYGRYQNFSDGLIPSSSSTIYQWSNRGMASAIANSGDDWRTIFLGYPFEVLPKEIHPEAINQFIGWLGHLGESRISVDARTSDQDLGLSSTRTFTISLDNEHSTRTTDIVVTNTLPVELIMEIGTLEGGALYNEQSREVTWQGTLDPNETLDIVYRATPAGNLGNGAKIINKVNIMDAKAQSGFWRTTSFWVNAPDFSQAIFNIDPVESLPNKDIAVQIVVPNTGQLAGVMSATVYLPPGSEMISGSLEIIDGIASIINENIGWEARLMPGDSASLAFQLQTEMTAQIRNLPVTIMIEDGVTDPVFRQSFMKIVPDQSFFPWVYFGDH